MKKPIDYIPKKHHPYISECYKESQCYGWLYIAVLEWPDGFCRLVHEENISNLKSTIKYLIETDRDAEF